MWNVMYTAEKCWIMITLVFCLQPERKKENFWKPAVAKLRVLGSNLLNGNLEMIDSNSFYFSKTPLGYNRVFLMLMLKIVRFQLVICLLLMRRHRQQLVIIEFKVSKGWFQLSSTCFICSDNSTLLMCSTCRHAFLCKIVYQFWLRN